MASFGRNDEMNATEEYSRGRQNGPEPHAEGQRDSSGQQDGDLMEHIEQLRNIFSEYEALNRQDSAMVGPGITYNQFRDYMCIQGAEFDKEQDFLDIC